MRAAVALLAVLALAGCSGGPAAREETAADGPIVEGWVVDSRLVPVAGASVQVIATGIQAATDEHGHYVLQAERGRETVLLVQATGHLPQSRALAAGSGAHTVVNFTLERVPTDAPYDEVASFNGVLRCGIVVTTQEDPTRPHEHQGVRCSEALNDTSNRWVYRAPAGATGVVLEADWDAQSEVAQALVLKATIAGTGEVVAFTEGTAIVRVQLSAAKLQQAIEAGQDILHVKLEPGAGTGNHEHGAAGAFLQQPFTLYATAFFNGPVPPTYSVADR